MSDAKTALVKLGFLLALLPFSIWAWAQAYSTLYGWFLLPLGAPAISMAHIYGLALVTRIFTCSPRDYDQQGDGVISRAITNGFVVPGLFVLTGYVIVHWIGI